MSLPIKSSHRSAGWRGWLFAASLILTLTLSPAQATTQQASSSRGPIFDSSDPGKEIAQTISLITGVAISPLLGTSAVGLWKYLDAKTAEERARLPWFAQPWFWIPAFILLTACFMKDTLGVTVPAMFKKPLDFLDAMEHKISGLVATGAFVPLVAQLFQSAAPQASAGGLFFAAIDLSWLGNLILVPIAMVTFFVVFMASNAINILILLSPFSVVDTVLKGFRLLLLLSVTSTALLNPWLGAAWSLVIIVVAFLVAGWSFRLSYLGLVWMADFLSFRKSRFRVREAASKMFLSRPLNRAPARSAGLLTRDTEGQLVFRYRPWLIFPERQVILPRADYVVGRGLFYSEVLRTEGEQLKPALLLPPRYRTHEEELAQIFGLKGVRETGLRAAFRWLREVVGIQSGADLVPA